MRPDEGCHRAGHGGPGFIGSHLVDGLIAAGARVRVLDDFSTGRRENLEHALDEIELIEGSVTDPSICEGRLPRSRIRLPPGAVPSVQRSVADPTRTHEVAAAGTLRMLVAAHGAGVHRFVYAGSSSATATRPPCPSGRRERASLALRGGEAHWRALRARVRPRARARNRGAPLLQRIPGRAKTRLPVFGRDPPLHHDGARGRFSA